MIVARAAAAELLDGVGDPQMERGFAMVATLCVHRAATDSELVMCPVGKSAHLAGPGVRELWRTELFPPAPPSLQRCEKGVWAVWRGIKVPGDCGECPPCQARTLIEMGNRDG